MDQLPQSHVATAYIAVQLHAFNKVGIFAGTERPERYLIGVDANWSIKIVTNSNPDIIRK